MSKCKKIGFINLEEKRHQVIQKRQGKKYIQKPLKTPLAPLLRALKVTGK